MQNIFEIECVRLCVCLCDKILQRHMFYEDCSEVYTARQNKVGQGPSYVITPGIKTLIQTQTVSGLYPNSKLSHRCKHSHDGKQSHSTNQMMVLTAIRFKDGLMLS